METILFAASAPEVGSMLGLASVTMFAVFAVSTLRAYAPWRQEDLDARMVLDQQKTR